MRLARQLWREQILLIGMRNLGLSTQKQYSSVFTLFMEMIFFNIQGAEDAGKKKNAPRGSSQKQRSMTQFLDGGEQSQSTSKVPQMSEEQVLEMAQSVVYFLITCGKDGNAVNRTDIQKTVLKNFPAKHYPVVMSKVAEILKDVILF